MGGFPSDDSEDPVDGSIPITDSNDPVDGSTDTGTDRSEADQ
ncbi:hypothetical protein [Natronosalvus vescus]|nr:hypothetical protein [Natronosalvus vescus]